MILQIKLALKDAKKNWIEIAFFTFQLAFFVVLTAIVLNGVHDSINYYKTFVKLNDSDLTGFHIYYSNGTNKSNVDYSKEYKTIENLFSQNKAISYVDAMQIPNFENVNVIIGLGMYGEVYKVNQIDNFDSIQVLIGENVNNLNLGTQFEIANHTTTKFKVNGRLPKDTFVFKESSLADLGDSVLILMSYEDFKTKFMNDENMSDFYKMIIDSHLNLIDVTQEEVISVTEEINSKNEIMGIPRQYNNVLKTQSSSIISNISFFIIIVMGACVFIFLGIFNNLVMLVEKNIDEYAINLMYGATLNEIYLRCFYYILIILLPSFLIALNLINLTAIIDPISISTQLFVIFVLAVILAVIPYNKLKNQDMLFFLRRDL